ncbi:type II toxin-antitoxin system Phd/YefM family antitoxin [Zooshikella ganghwensis]|uniref:Antitoxin n=1 Tax=Zooshikella ganghwensis TaxID=202772 RepID=A0A4P9VUU8_9GAMM|nr:type II toxin-antitoxin system Phd/YefM family antitoxin [Zooshikella ganghwensis]RDH46214.1 type II toxin-antitoxin system Phd/YefM family antitoxin [Zooshikella ganghwensis]
MQKRTFTTHELNQNPSEAKAASQFGPVFITEQGKPTHVLLTIDDYEQLTQQEPSILDLLKMPEDEDFDFEASKIEISTKPADFD